MTHQNLLDRLRSWLSADTTEQVAEDDEPDHRPIVGLESSEADYNHVAEYTFERTVELIHFAQGGTLVVEHDDYHHEGEKIVFKSFTDIVSCGNGHSPSQTTEKEFGNTVSTVNDMAVAHREEIGTIEVTAARPVNLLELYEKAINMDELPDEVVSDTGVPIQRKVAKNEHDMDFDKPWGSRGFEKYDGQVVWNRHYTFESFSAPTRIEQDKTMGEVLQNAVQGGASNMRAVSADGSILMPDSEIGGGEDVTQVQALPADDE